VFAMQVILSDLNYYNGAKMTGSYFDDATLAALMRFQLNYMQLSYRQLFKDDGSYIGCDATTAKELSDLKRSLDGPLGSKVRKGASYTPLNEDGTPKANPADRVTIVDGVVYRNLVSQEQLEQIFQETNHFQRGKVTLDMVRDLNSVLYRYDIKTKEQIQFFLGAAMHESRGSLTEAGYLPYEQQMAYLRAQSYWPFYGAGYIQISKRGNYERFSEEIGDPAIMSASDPAKYVADNWAWEAAGWWWEHNDMNNNIAKSQAQGLSNTEIFRRVSNKVLHGNYNRAGNTGNDWNDRLARYNEVIRVFK